VRQDLRDRTPRDQETDVSTSGTGGPQPPEQDPSQSGQPAAWGQQPPAGQQYPGGQPQQPWGAPQPPADQQYPGAQPQQPWGAPQPPSGQPYPGQQPAFGEPEKPKRKWLPIVGGIVALFVVLGALSSLLGGSSAEVGDCVNAATDEIGVVGCDDSEAAFTVVGVVEDVSQNELTSDPEVCADWPSAAGYAWEGTSPDDLDSDGTGYCLEELSD
jgi:hypothetical protein